MNITHIFTIIVAACCIHLGFQHDVRAQEPAPTVPLEAQRIINKEPITPFDVLHEEAILIIEKQRNAKKKFVTAEKIKINENHQQKKGGSRTIMVAPVQVTNTSKMFKFRDVTDRSKQASEPIFPLNQRKATVESYRQSLVKER